MFTKDNFILQVMVWKTNFDAVDVLKTQKIGASVDEACHTLVGQPSEIMESSYSVLSAT